MNCPKKNQPTGRKLLGITKTIELKNAPETENRKEISIATQKIDGVNVTSLRGNVPFDQFNDQTTVRAIIIVAPLDAQNKCKPLLRTYGAFLWGCGKTQELWGAGFADNDDIMKAIVVLRILKMHPNIKNIKIITSGLLQQLKYVAKSQNGETAQGDPFAGWHVLKQVQEAKERGKWEYEKLGKRAYQSTRSIPKGLVKKAYKNSKFLAYRCKEMFDAGSEYGIVADDSDADLDGMLEPLVRTA